MSIQDDYAAFLTSLNFAVDIALETKVADALKAEVSQSVRTNVYGVYTPVTYERREDDGGLSDTNNYLTYTESIGNEHDLILENITSDNGYTGNGTRRITEIVETGQGYSYWQDAFPRPFMEEALEQGIVDGSLESALVDGLRQQGIVID